MKHIPGRGPLEAKICILGEAPGKREHEAGRPFVGPSGQLLEGYLRRVGIDPFQVRYENVYPFLPPGKDGVITSVKKEELGQWMEDCLVRLDQLSEVELIVPVGNVALFCVTEHRQILLRRGSIYTWQQASGREIKVIPTIHPAAVLRDTTLEYRVVKDWERIAREMKKGSQVSYPVRKFLLDPPEEVLEQWLQGREQAEREGKALYIDIETNPGTKKILCIGFAYGVSEGISLSWNVKNMPVIQFLCGCEQVKGLQNGLYDCYWLRMFGVEVKRYERDCMAMNHLLRPNDTHSLAYMTSIHTNEPYYKGSDDEDEEKVWERKRLDWYDLLEYNARDAMVEYEVGEEHLWALVQEKGLEDHYYERYAALFEPLLDMMTHGISVDQGMRKEAFEELTKEAMACKKRAEELCGQPLFTITGKGREVVYKMMCQELITFEEIKALARLRTPVEEIQEEILEKGISGERLKEVLYKQWKLPLQKNRKSKEATVDEHALRTLLQKVEKRGEEQQAQFLRCVLRYRHIKKLSEFYHPSRVDDDGRMRCEYTYATRPSRLASRRNPMGGGANLQNQSRKVRGMFRADNDCILVEIDLSQIQARFVYAMAWQASGQEVLRELATNKPWEKDIHTMNAAMMYGVEVGEVTKEQRYKGKIVEHGTNFGLQILHLQEVFLKGDEGIYVPLKECEELIHRKFAAKPGILQWHQAIREEYFREKKITNAWGDSIDLSYERPGEDLWRKCYAWKPQIDEARHMNLLGVIPTWRYLREKGYKSKMNMQVHDALIMSLRPEEAWDVVMFTVSSLEQEREYYGVNLVIPCSLKIGKNWLGEKEWKKLPSKEEFEEEMERILVRS